MFWIVLALVSVLVIVALVSLTPKVASMSTEKIRHWDVFMSLVFIGLFCYLMLFMTGVMWLAFCYAIDLTQKLF